MLVDAGGVCVSTQVGNSSSIPKTNIGVKSALNTIGLKASPKVFQKSSAAMDVQARLANTPPHVLIRSISSLSQSSIRPRAEPEEEKMGSIPSLRKGILMQARDRLFSRWKERFFVLTRDYLACFRKGSTKYSEMGSFLFKVNLATVDYVGWEDRRGGPVLSVSLPREGKMLLRAKIGLDQWYRDLREATVLSRSRRIALKRGSSTMHLNQIANNNLQSPAQLKSGISHFNLSDSTPEIVQLCESVCHDLSPGPTRNLPRNRFSMTSNVEISSCDGDIATPPSSVTSSHKFSSCTSSNSGSGGSSSLASSPSLRSGVWQRPSSPVRLSVVDAGPRSRFSLYEGPRPPLKEVAKIRHSMCIEPRGLHADIVSVFRKRTSSHLNGSRHSTCLESRGVYRNGVAGSRTSLCLPPRNPLLELLEPNEVNVSEDKSDKVAKASMEKENSPAKSEVMQARPVPIPNRDGVDTSPSPPVPHRPRSQSTSIANKMFSSRSRTNIALFRNSALFN